MNYFQKSWLFVEISCHFLLGVLSPFVCDIETPQSRRFMWISSYPELPTDHGRCVLYCLFSHCCFGQAVSLVGTLSSGLRSRNIKCKVDYFWTCKVYWLYFETKIGIGPFYKNNTNPCKCCVFSPCGSSVSCVRGRIIRILDSESLWCPCDISCAKPAVKIWYNFFERKSIGT